MDIDASETLAVQDGGEIQDGGGISNGDQLLQFSDASDDHATVVSANCFLHNADDDPPSRSEDSLTVPVVVKRDEESNLLQDPPETPTGPLEHLKEDSSPDSDDDSDESEQWVGEKLFNYRRDFYDRYGHYPRSDSPHPYNFDWMHGSRFGDNRRHFSYRECYQPASEPTGVGAGLENLGLTCFVNAVLQCFTHSVPLVKGLRSWNHAKPCDRASDDFCMFCALRKQVEYSLSRSGQTIPPHGLVNNLNKISSYFERGQQEDAHEFHQAMLDKLERCSLDPNSGDNNPDSKKNIVDQIFGGRLVSKLRCCNCGHCSSTHETVIDLSLEIEHVDNLTAALESFTNVEKMEDPDCKFKCEKCEEEVSVEKQLLLEEEPTVAALHLKRFKSDGLGVEKIDKHVSFPLVLDLQPFSSSSGNDEVDMKYQLYAVVVHIGLSPTWGHYFSFIRSSPGTWHKFDDEKVIKVEEEFVLSQDAYILFYAKEGTPWFSSLMEGNQESDPLVGTSPKSVLDKVDSLRGPFPTSTPKDDSKPDKSIETPAGKEEGYVDDDDYKDNDDSGANGSQRENSISCTEYDVSKPVWGGFEHADIVHALKSLSDEISTLQDKEPSGARVFAEPASSGTMRKHQRLNRKRWISRVQLMKKVSKVGRCIKRKVSIAGRLQLRPSIFGFRSSLGKKRKVKRLSK